MVVYVDIEFVINAAIDACLLLLTASLLRRRVSFWSVLLAATVGSLYAVITLFPSTSWLRNPVWRWGCSLIMVDWAYGLGVFHMRVYRSPFRKVIRLLKYVIGFYAVTFAAGGAVYAIHDLVAPSSSAFAGLTLVQGRMVWWTSFSTIFILCSVFLGLMAVRTFWSLATRLTRDTRYVYPLEIKVGEQTVSFQALLDTGNTLCDPISRIPVAVVQASAISACLPPVLQGAVERGEDLLHALRGGTEELGSLADRMRVVPYKGVGGRGGYLLAFRPDGAWIIQNTKRREGDPTLRISVMPILFALQVEQLTQLNHYHCILPASVMDFLLGEGSEADVASRANTSASTVDRSTHSA